MKALQSSRSNPFRQYEQLNVDYRPDFGMVRLSYNSRPRPCFTPTLLANLYDCQQAILDHLESEASASLPLHYVVVGSSAASVHNLGGDLNLFSQLIVQRDKEGLRRYAYACINALHRNFTSLSQFATTIALVQGSALGGGFEAVLSCKIIIAEKGVELGFPEILFNLFPGMGAFSLLSRRIPMSDAHKMITSGRTYLAEDLFEMGVVDVLAERGEGEQSVDRFVEAHRRARNGMTAAQRAAHRVNPLAYDELADVAEIWVEAALNLGRRDLRFIDRLVRAQNRLHTGGAADRIAESDPDTSAVRTRFPR